MARCYSAYCRSKQFGNPTRSRRLIQGNPNFPIFGDIFGPKSMWPLQKSSFTIKGKIGVDSSEDTRRQGDDRCQLHRPIRHPSKRYDQKTIPIQLAGVDRVGTSGIINSAMPRLSLWFSLGWASIGSFNFFRLQKQKQKWTLEKKGIFYKVVYLAHFDS